MIIIIKLNLYTTTTKLTDDQAIDFEDLKKRQSDQVNRKVLKEEREELRRQAEDERKTQRELFQQQRELLLLSRRKSITDSLLLF
jgi:hypothetical protein